MSMEKLKALVHFIVHECRDDPGRLGAIRLNKALWFTDMWAYQETGRPVTGARYVKRKMGPVPKAILPALRELVNEGKIEIRDRVNYYEAQKYVSLMEPDVRPFSESDLEDTRFAVGFVCDNTTSDISSMTHDEVWRAAMEGEVIPLCATLATGQGVVTDDTKEWAAHMVQEIEAQK